MTTKSVYSVTWLKFQSNTDRAFNFPSNILFPSMKNLSFVCIGKVANLLVFRYCVEVARAIQHLIFHRWYKTVVTRNGLILNVRCTSNHIKIMFLPSSKIRPIYVYIFFYHH